MEWKKYGTNPELDKIIDSDDWRDQDRRRAIAEQGYGLDKLINDDEEDVRAAVAEQGYGLDKLINDDYWQVREACTKSDAWSEFCANNWETLICHEDEHVRAEVARQGYGLDILINDEDWNVRDACAESDAWVEYCANNWERLMYHKDEVNRELVARQGYGLDILVHDENEFVRAAVAEQCYGLDILVNDKDSGVRKKVAEQGYGLNVLIYDKDKYVRVVVAKQKYGLSFLINDRDYVVRAAVAEQGYGLDILINDRDSNVRIAVAKQGYGLDVLINDKGWGVSNVVKQYLKENNYKSLGEWMRQNPDKLCGNIDLQLTNDVKDFIYKIDESSKLEIQSNCDNIDDFFIEALQDILVIRTVDTKEPIIKIEKSISNQKANFKFIIDITSENEDNFSIKTTIKSKEQLNQNIEQTIEYLNQYPEFSKYIADLENCL